jgi:hypothetical protein
MPRKSAAALSVAPLRTGATRLRPPASLSASARKVFIDIVANEEPTHFRQSHMPLLVQYCEATALAERSIAEMRKKAAAPIWLHRWEKATRVMTALSMRLRLSPQSIAPNNPSRPKPLSYYEKMALETGDADDE